METAATIMSHSTARSPGDMDCARQHWSVLVASACRCWRMAYSAVLMLSMNHNHAQSSISKQAI